MSYDPKEELGASQFPCQGHCSDDIVMSGCASLLCAQKYEALVVVRNSQPPTIGSAVDNLEGCQYMILRRMYIMPCFKVPPDHQVIAIRTLLLIPHAGTVDEPLSR